MIEFLKARYQAILIVAVSFAVGLAVALVAVNNGRPAAGGNGKTQVSGPVTLSNCSRCHPNLDGFKNPILIFNHWVHFKHGIRCQACHMSFAHGRNGKTARPPMEVCYACHGLRHSSQGLVAPENCDACHPKSFNLMPANHTAGFRAGAHKKRAKVDLLYCKMCHLQGFCQKCHIAKRALPSNHKDAVRWRQRHGKQQTPEELNSCKICHAKSFCNQCHGTGVPHPENWIKVHRHASKPAMAKCEQCHGKQEFCQNCHHSGVWNGLLIKERCVRCHSVYKSVVFEIGSKPHAIHRAHFDMTKTEPFMCKACHNKQYPKGQGHYALELCKTCHGRERLGKLIAKWGVDNGEICMICHQGVRGGPNKVGGMGGGPTGGGGSPVQ